MAISRVVRTFHGIVLSSGPLRPSYIRSAKAWSFLVRSLQYSPHPSTLEIKTSFNHQIDHPEHDDQTTSSRIALPRTHAPRK